MRQGIKGEKDAAYYINADYRDDPDCAVLHDLRIVEEGEVAQIDHLLIRRASMILLETKNFTGNVRINAQGEFSVLYPSGKRMGIASPLEQSRRHEKILRKLLDRLGIKARLGASIPMQHLVLFHPQTILQRPDSKAFDTSRVIKADQLRAWLDHFVNEQIDILDFFKLTATNLRSADTVREWAEKIKRQHRPENPLELPPFMAPLRGPTSSPAAPVSPVSPVSPITPAQTPSPSAPQARPASPAPAPAPVCATCGQALTARVIAWCQDHADLYGGQLYCREHQPQPAPSAARRSRPAPEAAAAPVCAVCAQALTSDVVRWCRKQSNHYGGQLYCRAHQPKLQRGSASQ